jgi:predicted MFS family arabinose efflux permease
MYHVVVLLMLSVGIVGANALLLSPIAAAVAVDFPGAEAGDVLVAAAAYGLATALSALLLAPASDRIGADRGLRLSFAVVVISFAATGMATTLTTFVAAQALAGVATGVALPCTYALAAHSAPPGREARTMGLVLTGWTLSLVAGVSLAAFTAEVFGWRSVYHGFAVVSAGVLALLLTCQFNAPRTGSTSPLTALKVPGIGRALVAMAALMLAFYLTYTYMGAHITSALGQSTAAAGLLPLSYGLGFGASALLDRVIDRIGPLRAAPPLYAATVGLYLLISASAPSFFALIAAGFLWGITQHLCLNLAVGRLSALDARQRGAILGLNSTVTYLMVFAGAAVGRPLFETGGLATLALCSAALIAFLFVEVRLKGAWSVAAR